MRIIIVAFGLMLSMQGLAQPSFGVKAGANINGVRSDLPQSFFGGEYKPTIGYHAGVFMEIFLVKDRFSLNPELIFTQRGHAIDLTNSSDNLQYNLNYLELPILISYAPAKWFSIQAGPNVAYMLSAKSNFDQYIDPAVIFDHSFDYGVNVGFTIKAFRNFAVVARYYHGLSKITEMEFRDEFNVSLGSIEQYNINAEISVAYKIK
jgi:hypothetical protein